MRIKLGTGVGPVATSDLAKKCPDPQHCTVQFPPYSYVNPPLQKIKLFHIWHLLYASIFFHTRQFNLINIFKYVHGIVTIMYSYTFRYFIGVSFFSLVFCLLFSFVRYNISVICILPPRHCTVSVSYLRDTVSVSYLQDTESVSYTSERLCLHPTSY